jgi:hypothetical protein
MARDKQFDRQVTPKRAKPERETPHTTAEMRAPLDRALLTLIRRVPRLHLGVSELRRQVGNRTLQRLAQEAEFVAPPDVEERLASERGHGEPLEQPARAQMEGSLGADLGAVRIHRDSQAAALSRDLGARAFTHGTDVYFAEGEYAPATEGGQRVLAHELAHVTQQHDGAKLMVGAVHDPAEAEADAMADDVVRGLRVQRQRAASSVQRQPIPEEEELPEWEEEEGQPPERQPEEEEEEEEEAQALRRQPEEEEEGVQTLRRQETPEEEELQTLRRASSVSIPRTALRERATPPIQVATIEDASTLRRRVSVNVLTQTATEDAVREMTTVELRQQVTLLERWPELDAPQRENLTLLQTELQRRETALTAADAAELAQQCNRELGRLQRWVLSPGGLPLQALRAYDSAVGNFVDNTEATTSGGVQFSDIFGLVLAAIPFAGPIARWVGEEALRQATVAVAQAAAGTVASRATSLSEEASAREEQRARTAFAAQIRGESAVLADTLARNTDGVLGAYEGAVDAAQQAGNATALRVLLVNLQHENDQVRLVSLERYADLGRQFEIELYRRHYRTRAYIHVYESAAWGVHSREVKGIPDAVQTALRERLRAGRSMLDVAEAWGLRREVTRTSGGRQ